MEFHRWQLELCKGCYRFVPPRRPTRRGSKSHQRHHPRHPKRADVARRPRLLHLSLSRVMTATGCVLRQAQEALAKRNMASCIPEPAPYLIRGRANRKEPIVYDTECTYLLQRHLYC